MREREEPGKKPGFLRTWSQWNQRLSRTRSAFRRSFIFPRVSGRRCAPCLLSPQPLFALSPSLRSLRSSFVHPGDRSTRCHQECIPGRRHGRSDDSFYSSEGSFRSLHRPPSSVAGLRNPSMEFRTDGTSSYSLLFFSRHCDGEGDSTIAFTDSPLH